MSSTYRLFATLLCLLVGGAIRADAQDIVAAPADRIHDDSRVFDAASRAQLVAALRDFEQRTGIPFYLETLTFIDAGVTAEARCKKLSEAWLPTQRGVVLCFNRAEKALPAVEFSAAMRERYSAMDLAKIAERAVVAMYGLTDTRERLLAGIHALMDEMSAMKMGSAPSTALFTHEDSILAAAFSAVLVVGGLLGGLLVRRRRADEEITEVQFYLPEAEVGQRFGAACGGGVMAEISLGN